MKIGTIILLAVGVIIVNPQLQAPASSPVHRRRRADHSRVRCSRSCSSRSRAARFPASTRSSRPGTTSKMVDKESDIRPVGYMAMLFEGPRRRHGAHRRHGASPRRLLRDQRARPRRSPRSDLPMVNLLDLQAQVGENVIGRTGGAVSLAVGMAQIFSSLPGMRALMSCTGITSRSCSRRSSSSPRSTRARAWAGSCCRRLGGRVWKKWGDTNWMPSALVSTGIMVAAWGYFIWTGNISTIWPLFGVANQLLGSVGLAVATTILINQGRAKYAWATFLPLCFLAVSTMTAGWMNIRDNYWPLAIGPDPARHIEG